MNTLMRKRILVVVTLLIASPMALRTQTEQDVPTIEPTYTRIFASDTIEIGLARLSPDGRWVVFEAYPGAGAELWLVSTDGGEPVRLTDADFGGDGPAWFPTSDRIAFRSYGPRYWAVLTLPIDPQTGRPTGPARPVTLEPSSAYLNVSPDGKWIAYTPHEDGQRVIRIVPSTGGTARTLVAADTPRPLWSTDGRHIYYHVASGFRRVLVRIAVDGGEPDTLMSGFTRIGHSSLIARTSSESPVFDVTTLTGEPRARFRLPGEMRPMGTGPDSSNRFISIMSDVGTALHILPVDGGPPRQLTEGHEEDTPLAWTESDQILLSTQMNGNEVLLLAPAEGGAMRQVSLPEKRRKLLNNLVPPPFLSPDGSHLFYEVAGDEPKLSVLKVLTVADGTIEKISSVNAATDWLGVTGPGGVPNFDGPSFLYVERHENRFELRAWSPEGGSRLLWTFSGDEPPGSISVYGDRMVFSQVSGARMSLRIATFGDTRSRELLNVAGWLQSVGWSPDGRHLAMVHVDTSGGRESARVAFQQVSPQVGPAGDLQYVSERSLSWWNLRWLPDSHGMLANGWDDSNVWFFPVDPTESPVCLTQDDSKGVWEYVLSPDGRHIVYPRLVSRGSSIWMVDLGEIPEAAGR